MNGARKYLATTDPPAIPWYTGVKPLFASLPYCTVSIGHQLKNVAG